jgi:hypothetical protein
MIDEALAASSVPTTSFEASHAQVKGTGYHSRDTAEPCTQDSSWQHFNFQPPASVASQAPGDADSMLFPPDLVHNLVTILENTGASIVVSSTWRKRHDWLQDILKGFRLCSLACVLLFTAQIGAATHTRELCAKGTAGHDPQA